MGTGLGTPQTITGACSLLEGGLGRADVGRRRTIPHVISGAAAGALALALLTFGHRLNARSLTTAGRTAP